jgi:hypothetical protein
MSINFYWTVPTTTLPNGKSVRPEMDDPAIHIGKRTTNWFNWAQPPDEVKRIASARPRAQLIEDESGRKYTWPAFAAIIADLQQETRYIGTRFV